MGRLENLGTQYGLGSFGEEDPVLGTLPPSMAAYGYKTIAQKNAQQTSQLVRQVSKLGVNTPLSTQPIKTAVGSGPTVAPNSMSSTQVRPMPSAPVTVPVGPASTQGGMNPGIPAALGVVAGALLFGPVGALIGGASGGLIGWGINATANPAGPTAQP